MARYLVVANLTTESAELRGKAAQVIKKDPNAVFDVVVPAGDLVPALAPCTAVNGYTLRWERASRVRQRLASVGATQVRIHLAERDPLDEIDALLGESGFATVIVCTPRRRLARWFRNDLPGLISRRHPEVRVRVVTAPSDFWEDRPLVRVLGESR